MKILLQKIVRSLGFNISRIQKPAKSVRTDRLFYCKTKTGNFFLPRDAKGDEIANSIKANLIFDAEIYEVAKKYIKPDTIAIDIGSNFGQMSILMSKLVGQGGTVHAFEADDFIFKILQKNIAENSNNIIPHFGAVHNKSNETLYFPVQDFLRFSTYGSYGIDYLGRKGRPVKTILIDEIKFELPVSFMKIDIQGGDLFALQGAVKTINKYRMPIIFEYEYLFEEELNLCFQEYVNFVESIDYFFAKVINGQNYLILPKRVNDNVQ